MKPPGVILTASCFGSFTHMMHSLQDRMLPKNDNSAHRSFQIDGRFPYSSTPLYSVTACRYAFGSPFSTRSTYASGSL